MKKRAALKAIDEAVAAHGSGALLLLPDEVLQRLSLDRLRATVAQPDPVPAVGTPERNALIAAIKRWVTANPKVVNGCVQLLALRYKPERELKYAAPWRRIRSPDDLPAWMQPCYNTAVARAAEAAPWEEFAQTVLSDDVLSHAIEVELKGTVQACVEYCKLHDVSPQVRERSLAVARKCMAEGPGMAGHLARPGVSDAVRAMAIEKLNDPDTLRKMVRQLPPSLHTYRAYTARVFERHHGVHADIKRALAAAGYDAGPFLGYVESRRRLHHEATRPEFEWHALCEERGFIWKEDGSWVAKEVPEPPEAAAAAARAAVEHYRALELHD